MHPIQQALLDNWPWRPLTTVVLLALAFFYLRGWFRLHRVYPTLATPARLVALVVGGAALTTALLSPLYVLREQFLAARAAQQILLGILAPPLLWLACPFHVIHWGLPTPLRRRVTRQLLRRSITRRIGRFVTQPGLIWLVTVSVFLFWHDPGFVDWTLQNDWRYGASLWLFFSTYMLFWGHPIGTAPRLHRTLPIGVAFFYIILGGEVPNLITGITLAFQETPTYAHYATQVSGFGLTALQDQMISGGMIWFSGSFIYILSAVLVLSRFFRREDIPPTLPLAWHATERTIAPGLEHRVAESQWREFMSQRRQ